MIYSQSASAATTSVTIPAHLVGDLILVVTRAASATPPTKPTASGTVPNWNVAQSAGLNGISLCTAWFVAVATTTTTGTWTGASHICVMILSPDARANILAVAGSSAGNGASTQTIVYPALTFTNLSGSSWGVRCGTRLTAVTAVGTAPAGWTNRVIQPAGASALMSIHTLSGVTTSPVADSVSTTGTNTAYYAHTLEVTEQVPGKLVQASQSIKRASSY